MKGSTAVAAVIQNANKCYNVTYDKRKELLPKHHWIVFFFKWVARIESNKEPEPAPSVSGMSETAACPPAPIADDPPAPHLPSPLPPPVSNSSCQFR